MPTAVACPDKFRGTLRADEAAHAMAAGLRRAGFDDVVEMPMADGGEGTLETLLSARGGSRRRTRVTGPLGAPVDAEWAVLPGGVAIVEMARASGLSLVRGRNDPLRASTRGTGELIAAVRGQGFKRIVVAVGGSATTDGGLAAVETLRWSLQGLDVTVACDVETSFLDAARVYGPQKGATEAQISLLTRRLEMLAGQYRARTGVDVTKLVGAGAAGGLAGGLAAIGAQLVPGFDAIAEAVGLERVLEGADLVLTGEGKLDGSSLAGKVVGGALAWADDLDVARVAIIAGQVTDDARAALAARTNTQVLALTDRVWQPAEAYERAALLLEEAAIEAGRTALGTRET
ncbi:MAG TPA: glycerate kinase [Acidimicrobiia bacterium]|nr:glycerate kinase [Acidimicrobiia bacterium]